MSFVNWRWLNFDMLTLDELYEVLKLRQDVFILEQECLYPDLDGLDKVSVHLLGYDKYDLVAYLRIIPKAIDGRETMVIGRVLTSVKGRGLGLGKVMMEKTMAYLAQEYPGMAVQLSAQLYLQKFYASYGFIPISEPYDEDGIMHIDMRLEDA